jgi:hypothetical protein
MYNVVSMFNVVFDVQRGVQRSTWGIEVQRGVFNRDRDREIEYLHLDLGKSSEVRADLEYYTYHCRSVALSFSRSLESFSSSRSRPLVLFSSSRILILLQSRPLAFSSSLACASLEPKERKGSTWQQDLAYLLGHWRTSRSVHTLGGELPLVLDCKVLCLVVPCPFKGRVEFFLNATRLFHAPLYILVVLYVAGS